MVRMAPEGPRYEPAEPVFHFPDRAPRRKPQPVGNTKNVGIDGDRLFTKCRVQNDVGRLASHARQRLQSRAIVRHLPAVLLDQLPAGLQDVGRLGVVQADRRDVALKANKAQGAHMFGVRRGRKEGFCGLVDAAVGRLCREHDRNEQLKG